MINVDWGDQEEKIIVWKFNGQWTSDDFRRAVIKTHRMEQTKSYPVDGILDLRRALGAPRDLMTLLRASAKYATREMGTWVVISDSQLWRNLWNMARRLYQIEKIKVRFVNSVYEAYEILEEHSEL